jgi:hypothetical protein
MTPEGNSVLSLQGQNTQLNSMLCMKSFIKWQHYYGAT